MVQLLRRSAALIRQAPQRNKSLVTADDLGYIGHVCETEINYTKIGKGSHNVICLPGALGSWRTDFIPQLNGFDKHKFTIVALDPIGYGRSNGERFFDEKMFINDGRIGHQLMAKLKLLPYSIIGWSDGAITGMVMAANDEYAKHIERFVQFGGNAYVDNNDVKIFKSIANVDKWSDRMKAPMIGLYGEQGFRDRWSKWINLFCEVFPSRRNGDICIDALKNIKAKTLIVHGAKDPIVPDVHPNFIHKHIERSKLVVHDDGKHNLHLRHSDWFNKLVTDFLLER